MSNARLTALHLYCTKDHDFSCMAMDIYEMSIGCYSIHG